VIRIGKTWGNPAVVEGTSALIGGKGGKINCAKAKKLSPARQTQPSKEKEKKGR